MTNEKFAEIMRNKTNMSEDDIAKHIRDGFFAYTSYEEFRDNCIAGMCDEDDIPEMWDALDKVVCDGVEYRFDFCL